MHAQRERTPWRTYARAYGVRSFIRDPLAEILELLDRVLIRGEGWGPGDPLRGERRLLELFPGLLAKRARKRGASRHESTYRRALARGEQLGLLLVERRSGLPPLVSPAWWRHPADLPERDLAERIWSAAAARILPAWCAPLARPLRGYPVPVETGPSASLPNGIRENLPAQTGGTLLRCNASTLRNTVRDTVCATAQGEQRGTRPRPLHRPRKPLPIADPKLRETAQRTIRETEGESSWKGLEALLRIALRDNPEELVVSVLRETFNLWEQGSIEYPKGVIRKRLEIPCSLGETPTWKRAENVRETRPLPIADALPAILSKRPNAPPEPTPEQLAEWERESERERERAREQAEQEQKRAAERDAAERLWHQETRELQTVALSLCEGREDRRAALLAVRERRDVDALRELVALWHQEDRSHPPARAQRTLEAPQEALCAA